MATSIDTKLQELIINKMPQSVYDLKKEAGELSDTELYFTFEAIIYALELIEEYETLQCVSGDADGFEVDEEGALYCIGDTNEFILNEDGSLELV